MLWVAHVVRIKAEQKQYEKSRKFEVVLNDVYDEFDLRVTILGQSMCTYERVQIRLIHAVLILLRDLSFEKPLPTKIHNNLNLMETHIQGEF